MEWLGSRGIVETRNMGTGRAKGAMGYIKGLKGTKEFRRKGGGVLRPCT